MSRNGFTVIEVGIVSVVVIVLAAGGYWLYSQRDKPATKTLIASSTQQTAAANGAYAVLSPATVPSKTAECSQSISYASNGVPGPVQCASGDLNVTDWQALAALEPKVMTLGYSASATQVQSALCSDVDANISNPIEETVYQIASLYYGWNFGTNPSVVISNGTCVNVDD